MEKKMVPWRERISYGLGDTASNLSFNMISTFLMYFYTEVLAIGAGIAGTIMLIARIWDAVFDPIMGTVIDKTHTKYGRCRPYFLWMAVPYGTMLVLVFTAPNFSLAGKVAYAIVTYLVFGMVYSSINLPLSAMLPSMSDNPQERTAINSTRMICARLGAMVATMVPMPLVAALGSGNKAKGMFLTVVIFACTAVILYFITFANTKERVAIQKSQEKIAAKDGIKATFSNKYWWMIAGASLLLFTTITMMMQSAIYFFTNYFKKPNMMVVFAMTFFLSQILAMMFTAVIAKRIGKRNTIVLGMFTSAIGVIIRIIAGTNAGIFFAGNIVVGLGGGLASSLLLAMMADAVDVSELKHGVRAQGLMYAADSFSIKMGTGLGGAVCGWVMAAGHYVSGATQSLSAINAIVFNFQWGPLIGFAAAGAIMLFYDLDKSINQVRIDLKQKREAGLVEA